MKKIFNLFFTASIVLLLLLSCQKNKANSASFYFGGEIINPKNNFVILMHQDDVVDTLYLNEDNFFLKKINNLNAGLYSFIHGDEYQYLYFDNNDSLMIRLNTNNFDESLVFCGRGDEKNNFLIELFLKNQTIRGQMYEIYDLELDEFNNYNDSLFSINKNYYIKQKDKLNWNHEFDYYAKNLLYLNYYIHKEKYPLAHNIRTGHNQLSELPKDYFNFRKNIDFDNEKLLYFSPFMRYLNNMMSNITHYKVLKSNKTDNFHLEASLLKLHLSDSIFKNQKIKNKILKNIAYSYLLEDHNIDNNTAFVKSFKKYSKDKETLEEINSIGNNIQNLKAGNYLPNLELIDSKGNVHNSTNLLNKKSIVFFWTNQMKSHKTASHKRVSEIAKTNPEYQLVSINLDMDNEEWLNSIKEINTENIISTQAANSQHIKDSWVILKLQRTFILGDNGVIAHPFINLFEVDFEKKL